VIYSTAHPIAEQRGVGQIHLAVTKESHVRYLDARVRLHRANEEKKAFLPSVLRWTDCMRIVGKTSNGNGRGLED